MLVVCKGEGGAESLALLRASLKEAGEQGLLACARASPRSKVTKAEADQLLAINGARPSSAPTTRSRRPSSTPGNNDRIVIMPGLYTEPESRSKPENDPTCNPSLLQEDASGDLTPSYEYQVTCPNDQNLIYVQGRAVAGEPPEPPLADRQGIPA